MLKHRSTRLLSIAMTGTLLLGSVLPQGLAGRAYAAGSVADHVVISQIYPGGGNASSSYKNDFIELYNPTDAPQDLAGWSVQYASAAAAFSASAVTPLSGTIAPHSYFLIQGAAGTSTNNPGGPLPVTPDVIPDAAHTLNLAATNGKVALAKVATAVGGAADGNVVDFLGYGSANESYGTAATGFGSSNSKSLLRKTNSGADPYTDTTDGNGWDTKTNSNDFVLGSSVLAPRSSQSSQPTPTDPAPTPTGDPVSIASIRQNDPTNGSPTNKGLAYTIEGVVTVEGNALGSSNANFYVQDATGGINIFDKNNKLAEMTIHKGDTLRLSGAIDFYGGLTELIPTAVEYKQAGTVPAPADMTIADLNSFAVAEPLEGTLVKVTGKVTDVAASSANYNVTLMDGDKAIIVRVMAGTAIDVASKLVVGNSYTVTGIVGQYVSKSPYTSGYQVFPRNADDLAEFHVLSLQHEPLTSANLNTDMPFTAVAEGADSVKLYYKGESDSEFTSVAMTSTDNVNYTYTLPAAQVTFSSMQYYIEAEGGGKVETSGTSANPHAVSLVTDAEGPVFSQESPLNGTRVENNRPEISVKMDDPSGIDLASVQVLLDGQDVTAQATVQADGIKLAVDADLALASHQVEVSATDTKHNANHYEWSFTVVEPFQGGNHYRGTTHNHTNISHDGAGAPEQALIAAKAHQYDFFAFSDHSHDIDKDLLGQDTVDHNGKPERTGGSDWQLTKDLADQYTENGEFVVFPAFEMTSTTWGHSNVFGTKNFIDRNINNKMYQDLNNYYGWVLTYDDIVAQFNHPDMSANAFNNFTPYDKNLDKLFTMLEVGNGSGNYSYANAERKFYSALDLGWHVTPTFGEDNHDGTWGQTKKRTVIVSQDLSQASLLDSMRNMRVYMEEDPNVTLDVTANGFYMGSIVPSKSLDFSIKMSDPVLEDHSMPEYSYLPADYKSDDRVAKVEIISNGAKVIDSYVPSSDTTTVDWTPDTLNVTGGQQWFVVKVTQKDGDQIYSSPIWTPEADVDVKVSGLNVVGSALVA
ncbi:MAG: CehA/McbA family metallohydrolase, partial [Tumebacillaceae bacterium]